MTFPDRSALICSVNRALWGEVGPNLRAVEVKTSQTKLELRFFIDGEPSEEDCELASVVGTEVLSDFPDLDVTEHVIRFDAPAPTPREEDWLLIYARREPG